MRNMSLFAFLTRFARRKPYLAATVSLLCSVGAASLFWVVHQRAAATALTRHRSVLHDLMDEDTTAAYRQVVHVGHALSESGQADVLIEEMITYAATILAIEHQDEHSLSLSRAQLQRHSGAADTQDALGSEGYLTAARILSSYGDGDLTEGLALAESMRGVSEGQVMARLEGLRLMVAAKVESPKIAATASDLGTCVQGEVRALNYLGLWHLSQGNTAQGEAYLLRAQRKSPAHPQVLLGLQWVRLFAPHPPPEDVWRAQQTAEEVLRAPSAELTPPIRATALLLRAQASLLEGDAPRAERDRAEAVGLDPGNLLHEAAHDGPARP